MILDPLAKEKGCRYPDETIVPTALSHLTATTTYVVSSAGTVSTFLRWKVTDYAATTVPTIQFPGALTGVPAPTFGDYGAPQAAWIALDAVDRTLAMGIRVRLVGLPTSTFLPSGTLYFLQVQEAEQNAVVNALALVGESAAIQAVTAGKGFSMTVNELSKLDGVTSPFLPQGPMSFVFSDKNSSSAAIAGNPTAGFPSQVVSANPVILVVGYGLEAGMQLRFDYAHHVEYIPTIQAAGLVATAVEPPSATAREGIARASALVQDRLAGATRGTDVAAITSGGPSRLVTSLGRAAVGLIPGGAALAGMASSVASGLGAPAWLTSALSALA